jgi:hypothetical protein
LLREKREGSMKEGEYKRRDKGIQELDRAHLVKVSVTTETSLLLQPASSTFNLACLQVSLGADILPRKENSEKGKPPRPRNTE